MHKLRGTRWRGPIASLLLIVSITAIATAQPEVTPPPSETEDPVSDVPREVDVEPVAEDFDISKRLTRILEATQWFREPRVQVDEGVVFLTGQVDTLEHKTWAGRLASNTQDVVAVVNRVEVIEKPIWDLSPAWHDLRQLGADTIRNSPLLVVGLLMLALTWMATRWSVRGASRLLHRRLTNPLLRDVAARAVAIPVFLLGLYLVLRVSGLTRLAMTVVGGTGLFALVLGFAFRDIAENFLASVLISIQRPFAKDDLVCVSGHTGFVQRVNTRATLLMTLDGNHVQLPNATVYKETIINYTANPNSRFDFTVGIGYDDSIATAQSVAMSVLRNHPAVVDDPESLVLVESLGAATVNLRIYTWVDSNKHSLFKVQSAIIRLTKHAFEQAGISMPDEAREVVFPKGVPLHTISDAQAEQLPPLHEPSLVQEDKGDVHSAEGNLVSEADEIQQQARQSRIPEGGQNLLE